ncbi:MAG TPA: metallophosphoesterase family protein [Candidatus Dormibacteraeota bacterium]
MLAVFSDVHGNMHALRSVVEDIRRASIERTYCLGDVVGYGAFPNEVIELLDNANIPTVMGNYDDGTGFDRDECGCAYRDEEHRRLGDQSFQWTKAHVTHENKALLRKYAPEIRFTVNGLRFLLVHGSPRRINEYLFEDRPESTFQRIAESARADVIICGHTHKPYVKDVAGVRFVNVGSAGYPKDCDPRACYALIETDGKPQVTFKRLAYDVAGAAAAIRRQNGLPHQFAHEFEGGGIAVAD